MNAAETPSPSVMDEFCRLDKIIRDCEHGLLCIERARARGRIISQADINDVTSKKANAERERNALDQMVSRYLEANMTDCLAIARQTKQIDWLEANSLIG